MGFLKLIRVTLIYTSKYHFFIVKSQNYFNKAKSLQIFNQKKFDIFPHFSTSFR